jgi:hypothetical protein
MLHDAKFISRVPGIVLGVAVSIVLALVLWNDLDRPDQVAQPTIGIVKKL